MTATSLEESADSRTSRTGDLPHRFRILLAEDDVEMRRLVASALRDEGHNVVELVDGGKLLAEIAVRARARAEDSAVDLVISDIRMPVSTGLQIVEALRRARWRTPVILMTAFGDDATRRQAELLDAVLFDKPFDLDDLRATVEHLLRRAPLPELE